MATLNFCLDLAEASANVERLSVLNDSYGRCTCLLLLIDYYVCKFIKFVKLNLSFIVLGEHT